MGDVVDIKPVRLEENHGFVQDCCRYQEQLLTESRMKMKYGFAEEVWQKLGDDTALLMAVEDEKIRRIHNGDSKREKAQLLVVAAPGVMSKILLDEAQSPRHRIDAAASLDKFAANPQDHTAAAAGFFQITINLGADTDGKPIIEHYNKPLVVDPNDGDPDGGFVMPQRSSPASIPDRQWDDSDAATVVPTHTGYGAATHKAAASKKPTRTVEPARVEKTPLEIAVESMMRY